MTGIYKITNPNNRVYIGQSVNIKNRFYTYKKYGCKRQPILFKSFLKYGVDNHIFEIIEECNIEFLNEKERYWQDYYDVLNGGLNCILTETNSKKRLICEETKKKLGKKNKESGMFCGKLNPFFGKKHTEETKEILRYKNSGENSFFYGKKRPEHSERLKGKNHFNWGKKLKWKSDSNKKRIGLLNPRSIILLDLNNGVFYYSLKDYCDINKIDISTLRYKLKNNKINGIIKV